MEVSHSLIAMTEQLSYNTGKRNAEAMREHPPAWRLVSAVTIDSLPLRSCDCTSNLQERFMFYIYGLRVKGDSEYRYIGCTSEPATRLMIHNSERRAKAKYEWMQQNRGKVEMVILSEVADRYDAAVEETRTIRKYKQGGHRLLNSQRSAAPTRDVSDETKEKMSRPRNRRMSKEQRVSELQKWLEKD